MAVMELKIVDRYGNTKAAERGEDAVSLVYTAEYEEGGPDRPGIVGEGYPYPSSDG